MNLRLPTSGVLNGWRLLQGGRETRVRIDGPLVFNTIDLILDAAHDGHGLAYLPLDQARAHLDAGAWSESWAASRPVLGYHRYYPTRRHRSLAFGLFVEAVRWVAE